MAAIAEQLAYRLRPGLGIPAHEVPALVEALEGVAKRHDGVLRTADVLEAAGAEDSPLHKRFTWDDTEAGEKWRLHEARLLTNHVEVLEIVGERQEWVKAWINVRVVSAEGADDVEDESQQDGRRRAYVTFRQVQECDDYRQQALADLERRLDHFAEAYRQVSAIPAVRRRYGGVIDAIARSKDIDVDED
jgi:hypothetical protein